MPVRGRKPKPTALKIVRGNPGRRPLPKHEPKPKRVIPSPPAHLSDAARVAWGSLAARFDRLGLLTEQDPEALEQLCENYAEILMLRADLATHGWFEEIERTNGSIVTVARAAYEKLTNAEVRFRTMMTEFGMTPSSRARVAVTPDDDAQSDPAAAYGL